MHRAIPFFAVLLAACSGVTQVTSDAGGAASVDAGGGAPGEDAGAHADDLPCDVARVLHANCTKCHGATPLFGAPMPLLSHADLHAAAKSAPGRRVFELVRERVASTADPMPPLPNAPLVATDQGVLSAWADAGAPARTGTCEAPVGDGGPSGGSATPGPLACTPDVSLTPTGTWTMPQATTDEYVCFGVDVPVTAKKQIVALAPKIVNTKIVHHVLLFQTPEAVAPTHTACGAGGGSGWRIVFGWAPGGQNLTLPPEAGFPLEGTTHFAVQIHYSNLPKAAGETDTSGFVACTTSDLRPNDADVLAFGTTRIDVPARGTADRTCDFTVPAGYGDLHVVAALPHMHKIGKAIETSHLPAGGGAPVNLGRVPAWNFDNQLWFGVSSVLRSGDKVRTRCAWENPTDTRVRFGEKTEDEMCYSFTMYYPRVRTTPWNWQVPAFTATCVNTP